ncbi:hypothetical protein NQ317_010139 [Molorchus minor]|uniref:Zinc finger CCCH-type with G patch domain-containing protein n=1 Tax=Molorchus minor TaxID=1323400 RepID=A0ABQ9JH38_9CUCU|nr:hypothetical protein NQ317_010139 [Molorchus minor]
MDPTEYDTYKQQLSQIEQALVCSEGDQKDELLLLKSNIEELLSLSNEHENATVPSSSKSHLEDEFALFMSEMKKEGAVEKPAEKYDTQNIEELKDIEGVKCKAPHKHQWGHVAYHNAMICSVVPETIDNYDEIKVRVLYINPTHQEMLPCPYYYESDCKFSEEMCRFSHGEIVLYSSLQEYVEPKFDLLTRGSVVLAKRSDNLWYRAIVVKIYENKCLVKFESNRKQEEVVLEHIFPLSDGEKADIELETSEEECEKEEDKNDDVINMSLMIGPSSEALGSWERYTNGIGSKLMRKMGYIVGTGLGKKSDGRVDPVTAVILPAGKSLDHCMKLREQSGGDKDLFSVEKKLKKMQRKQEMQSKKAYERESKKVDVFNFINKTLGEQESAKERLKEKQRIKEECSRSLNIKSLQISDNIRRIERDLEKMTTFLSLEAKQTREKRITPYKVDLSNSESEENENSPKKTNPLLNEFPKAAERAGPTGRQTVIRKKASNDRKFKEISSDSDDTDIDEKGKVVIPGEYDPEHYENLDVDGEIKECFQYIPQQLNLDYKFKPFVPEFLPAVGDIDAFLKVVPPTRPSAGILLTTLRAASVNPVKKNDANVVVKKIDNVEKNSKVIDKWIKDVSDLHKTKSSPVVRYSEPMPDLDDLMQEWPDDMEKELKENGFPKPGEHMSVSEYADMVCKLFQIPVVKNKIQSLHLLFCLYAAIKQTQLYQSASATDEKEKMPDKKEADQLVLE